VLGAHLGVIAVRFDLAAADGAFVHATRSATRIAAVSLAETRADSSSANWKDERHEGPGAPR
jgi:hypothetical protein